MTTYTPRATYWHRHPRDFSNECSIVRCETVNDRLAAARLGYSRLTVTALRRHVRWMNDENDAWGSNRAFAPYDLQAILSERGGGLYAPGYVFGYAFGYA